MHYKRIELKVTDQGIHERKIFQGVKIFKNLNTLKNLALMNSLICHLQFNSFIVHTITS